MKHPLLRRNHRYAHDPDAARIQRLRDQDTGSAVVCLGLGLAVLAGGGRRFSGPSYVFANTLAPHWVWGLTVLVAGLVIAAGLLTRRPGYGMFGHFIAATWALFFALSIIGSAFLSPTSGLTGIVIYAAFARIMVIRARRNRAIRWRRRRG